MPKIKILRDEPIYRGKYLTLVKRHFTGTKGKPGVWETIQRIGASRIVAIAPVTHRKELILTKIYRIPLKKYVIELCIGLKDKKGESDEEAVRRELLEETGYGVKKIERILIGPSNPGLVNDDIAFFIGSGAKKITEPHCENGEDISVLKVPLSRVMRFLSRPPRGAVVDIKIYIALFFLAKRGYKVG
jgi:ADP-ribose pyrophosphatase